MGTPTVADLLTVWRTAERRWERPGSDDDVRVAAFEVLRAWTAYQDAAIPASAQEFLLVADDDGSYVAATRGVSRVLGYEPDELIGQRIEDLAAPELRGTTPEQWSQFLADGRQAGSFRLRAKDGALVTLAFQARAHHPVPGFHVSRLWPEQRSATGGSQSPDPPDPPDPASPPESPEPL